MREYTPKIHDIVETAKGERTLGAVKRIVNQETALVVWREHSPPVREKIANLRLIFRLKPAFEMKNVGKYPVKKEPSDNRMN